MLKLTDSASFFQNPEDQQATLLFEATGGLTKQAAALEIEEFTKNIEPRDGYFYLHINAMGAGEYYGSNRNGDYFPEEQLIKWHKTFETEPAHVFRHHVNKDPAKSIGKVIYSYYNPRMHRVELIAEVSKTLGAAEYAAILAGDFPMTSMACKTPYDVCSICGNQAHSLMDYCHHLKAQINQLAPSGKKVMSLNLGPLRFFDISIVIRPADVTSSVLQKVASDIPENTPSVVAARAEGLEYQVTKEAAIKEAALNKASELVKEIEGDVVQVDDSLDSILSGIHDPDAALIFQLKDYPVNEILNAFADLAINPSAEFMASLLAAKYLGFDNAALGAPAIEAFLGQDSIEIPEHSELMIPDVEEKEADPGVLNLLVKYIEASSYRDDMVEKRAVARYSMPDGGQRTGYTNWDAGRTSTATQGVREVSKPEGGTDLLQLLYTIAGGALIAKYVVSGLTSIKINKSQTNWLKSSVDGNPMMKKASAAPKLMELSIKKDFSRTRI